MNMPSGDAQRELEQRALRNVRKLVDKIEEHDQLDGRKQKRALLGVALLVAAFAAMVFAFLFFGGSAR